MVTSDVEECSFSGIKSFYVDAAFLSRANHVDQIVMGPNFTKRDFLSSGENVPGFSGRTFFNNTFFDVRSYS